MSIREFVRRYFLTCQSFFQMIGPRDHHWTIKILVLWDCVKLLFLKKDRAMWIYDFDSWYYPVCIVDGVSRCDKKHTCFDDCCSGKIPF